MSAFLFTSCDLQKLLMNKYVVVIGDSVMRCIYKDIVHFLQYSSLIDPYQLRRRGERCFDDDRLLEGGELGEMTNGKNYREVRQFQTPCFLVRFYFITRVYYSYVEEVLTSLRSPVPDVIIMNSCLWDITRYGPHSMDCYEVNLQRFFYTLKQVIPKETLVIWTTALPVARFIRGGFLLDSVNFLTEVLRLDQLLANFFAKQVVDDYGFDVLDLHYIFRNRLSHRRQDGIHWDSFAHRDITFKYGGGNSTTAEEVFRFQCLFPNPNWLVWKGIPPPKTRSNFPWDRQLPYDN